VLLMFIRITITIVCLFTENLIIIDCMIKLLI